jgi:hypothetical protein
MVQGRLGSEHRPPKGRCRVVALAPTEMTRGRPHSVGPASCVVVLGCGHTSCGAAQTVGGAHRSGFISIW